MTAKGKKAEGEAAVREKIAAMPGPFAAVGERLHGLIRHNAPGLEPGLWYGMPAYKKDGKTVCFFRADKKYMTFGLTQEADLACEAGQLIECAWYFTAIDDGTEAKLRSIVGKLNG